MVRAISSLQVAVERDALDAVGDYECPAGMSVEDVSAVVKIKTPKRDSRLKAHKLESGWFVGVTSNRNRWAFLFSGGNFLCAQASGARG